MEDSNNASQEAGQSDSQDDVIKNLKAEMSRKQDNLLQELSDLKKQLASVNDVVIQSSVKSQPAQQSDAAIPDPVLDPEKYRDYIRSEMRREMEDTLAVQNQRQAQLNSLVSQYPELQDSSSDLTKKAIEIYNGLSAAEKNMPSSYKLAVSAAAQDLGVMPVNKRKAPQDQEDFTINSSSASSPRRPQQRKEEKLDDATVEFARLLGRPVDDPKYLEKLKSTAQRKAWSKPR